MRYPKAAKKKRIIKKWINTFGIDDYEMAKLIYSKNPFVELLSERDDPFSGKYFPVPLTCDISGNETIQPHSLPESDEPLS